MSSTMKRPPAPAAGRRALISGMGALLTLAAVPALAGDPAALPPDVGPHARQLLRWITGTGDHQGRPFAVVDKPAARIHVFSAQAQWLGSAPVLLGAAHGDHSLPGVGERPLASIRLAERTTPAGRFAAEPGRNLHGEAIVWIDYDAAVSLHRVRSANAAERRLQRLASSRVQDRRISYGCINVPEAFYNQWIAPGLGMAGGVVYILPDTDPFASIFVAASAYP